MTTVVYVRDYDVHVEFRGAPPEARASLYKITGDNSNIKVPCVAVLTDADGTSVYTSFDDGTIDDVLVMDLAVTSFNDALAEAGFELVKEH